MWNTLVFKRKKYLSLLDHLNYMQKGNQKSPPVGCISSQSFNFRTFVCCIFFFEGGGGVYPTMVWENFQIYSFQMTEKSMWQSETY